MAVLPDNSRMRLGMVRRVLVTGGSGFIGGHLCEALSRDGFEPVVLDVVAPRTGSFEFHQGAVSDLGGRLGDLVDGVEAIYHLAWTTTPQSASDAPISDVESNIIGSLGLLDTLVRRPTRPRLIFLSSGGAVYGPAHTASIAEDHPTFPVNAYGVSKLAFEHYLRLYRHLHRLEYLVFRPSNPYGERQNPNANQGAVAVFLGKIAAGRPITIWGDGQVVRDYLYIGDLADGLARAMHYVPDSDDSRVFNVGSGEGTTLRELIAAMERVTGIAPEVVFTEPRKTDSSRVVLDIRRMAKEMGWTPATGLDEGLIRTWQWIKGL